jgi:hypothetical protein
VITNEEQVSVPRALGMVTTFEEEPAEEQAQSFAPERAAAEDAELRPASAEDWAWYEAWELLDDRGGHED